MLEISHVWPGAAPRREPFGLKRFDRDRFPELYVATLDEFADPVESDTEEMKLFRPLLARTQLQSRELQLLYDADVHGWSAEAFHGCVDRKGACVGIAATEGAVFGYYNPKGHVGYGESRGSIAAFLFTWQDGDTSKSPVKLRKVGRGALACIDDPDSGPKLGADSFVVPLRPPRATWDDLPEDRVARSKLGSYFERLPTGNNRSSLFAEGENLKGEMLRYLRVYAGVYGEDEEIPFNDVSALYRDRSGGARLHLRRLGVARSVLCERELTIWPRNPLSYCFSIVLDTRPLTRSSDAGATVQSRVVQRAEPVAFLHISRR